MRMQDVHDCVQLIAAHPVQASRYGSAISHLEDSWKRLLVRDGCCTTVVVEVEIGFRAKIAGVGLSAFVTDKFLREAKTAPSFWIGPELTRKSRTGDAGVLTEKEVAAANSSGGLNLAVWEGTVGAEFAHNPELGNALMAAFFEYHRGYRLKELIGQAESAGHLEAMCTSGGEVWNFSEDRYEAIGDRAEHMFRKPHLAGMTREIALGKPGSWGNWMTALFAFRAPRLGLSRSEQRLLIAALDGGTDQELSRILNLSLNTVKKNWRSIYDRAAASFPELIPGDPREREAPRERGRTKKQRLIAYLREHHEELRPVSRKLREKRKNLGSELRLP
jgi:DNA-binding CsgD family transcriptional regulator